MKKLSLPMVRAVFSFKRLRFQKNKSIIKSNLVKGERIWNKYKRKNRVRKKYSVI